MKHNFLKIMIGVCLVGGIISCKKVLDTRPLNNVDIAFTTTREGLIANLVSIYDGMQSSTYYGRDFIVIPELLADNTQITANNTNRFISVGNNTPNNHVGIYALAYRLINRANIILKYADESTASAAEKAQLKAESYFLRGLMYHDLVKGYARAPLFLNTSPQGVFDLGVAIVKDPNIEAATITFPARSKVSEVYDFIVEDLKAANSTLSNNSSSALKQDAGPYRATKVAAQALLSRVELYRGNWAESERWADSVLLQNAVPLAPASKYFNLQASPPSWGNGHAETIYGLKFENGENTPGGEGLQYIYYRNLPTIQGYADVHAQPSLRSALGATGSGSTFTSTDIRFTKLISVQVKGTETVFYTLKWPGLKVLGLNGYDDIMILRTSEVVLNRAEARARQGKEFLAITDLNMTRTRAGLTAFPTSGVGTPTGAALITEILKERRVELAFEGHRLWDILRNGLDVIKSPSNIFFGSSSYNFLYANISQADLDANPKLVRNPGY